MYSYLIIMEAYNEEYSRNVRVRANSREEAEAIAMEANPGWMVVG